MSMIGKAWELWRMVHFRKRKQYKITDLFEEFAWKLWSADSCAPHFQIYPHPLFEVEIPHNLAKVLPNHIKSNRWAVFAYHFCNLYPMISNKIEDIAGMKINFAFWPFPSQIVLYIVNIGLLPLKIWKSIWIESNKNH